MHHLGSMLLLRQSRHPAAVCMGHVSRRLALVNTGLREIPVAVNLPHDLAQASLPFWQQFSGPLACRWQMLGGDSPRMATLVGDAAHPMTPNLGQGGCCALEVQPNSAHQH